MNATIYGALSVRSHFSSSCDLGEAWEVAKKQEKLLVGVPFGD